MMMNRIQVLQPIGVLNAAKTQEFRDKISEIQDSGAKIVLVDLKEVTFMDSSGLGALVLAFKTLRAADSKLVICSINEQVRILFELTGMDKVFEIFSTQDEFHNSILSRN
jgi:anti-anti-sigma factor